jgi:hypothetical protein
MHITSRFTKPKVGEVVKIADGSVRSFAGGSRLISQVVDLLGQQIPKFPTFLGVRK